MSHLVQFQSYLVTSITLGHELFLKKFHLVVSQPERQTNNAAADGKRWTSASKIKWITCMIRG